MSEYDRKQVIEAEWQGQRGSIPWAKSVSKALRKMGRDGDAHMVLVSPYLSDVKRNKWRAPLRILQTLWHACRTLLHDRADDMSYYDRSVSDLNILAASFSKFPGWFNLPLKLAQSLVLAALDSEHQQNELNQVLPHDTALNFLVLVRIKEKMGAKVKDVLPYIEEAMRLKEVIFKEEDRLMASRQWVRISFECGVWYYTHGYTDLGLDLVYEAEDLAIASSKDQLDNKIRPWLQKQRIRP